MFHDSGSESMKTRSAELADGIRGRHEGEARAEDPIARFDAEQRGRGGWPRFRSRARGVPDLDLRGELRLERIHVRSVGASSWSRTPVRRTPVRVRRGGGSKQDRSIELAAEMDVGRSSARVDHGHLVDVVPVHQGEHVLGGRFVVDGPRPTVWQDRESVVESVVLEEQAAEVAVGHGPEEPLVVVHQQQDRPPGSVHPIERGSDRVLAADQDVVDGHHARLDPQGVIGRFRSAASTTPGGVFSSRNPGRGRGNPRGPRPSATRAGRRPGWRRTTGPPASGPATATGRTPKRRSSRSAPTGPGARGGSLFVPISDQDHRPEQGAEDQDPDDPTFDQGLEVRRVGLVEDRELLRRSSPRASSWSTESSRGPWCRRGRSRGRGGSATGEPGTPPEESDVRRGLRLERLDRLGDVVLDQVHRPDAGDADRARELGTPGRWWGRRDDPPARRMLNGSTTTRLAPTARTAARDSLRGSRCRSGPAREPQAVPEHPENTATMIHGTPAAYQSAIRRGWVSRPANPQVPRSMPTRSIAIGGTSPAGRCRRGPRPGVIATDPSAAEERDECEPHLGST